MRVKDRPHRLESVSLKEMKDIDTEVDTCLFGFSALSQARPQTLQYSNNSTVL